MATTASCSISYALQLSRIKPCVSGTNPSHTPSRKSICSVSSPASITFPRRSQIAAKWMQFRELSPFTALATQENANSSQELAVILEVDGVLIDAYRWGNRQAFNVAFQKLGLDCANWPEPVYSDLLRKSAGDEGRMLILYFNRIGWPTSLPTSEKGGFVKSVLKNKKTAMDELLTSESLPLRSGVEEFIDNAHNEGVPIAAVAAYSKTGEEVARSIVERLGNERVSKIKIIGSNEVEQSMYGRLALGKGIMGSGLDEQLADEARKAASAEKQRVAEEVASLLKLSVDLDTSSSESLQKQVAALRAAAEHVELPVTNCILVAGSHSGVAAADAIGMPCVVLRSSYTSRAEFPSAKAIMDGFGGADLTLSKLRHKLNKP